MPSFPASYQQENMILQPSTSKQSQHRNSGNQVPASNTMKGSLPQHDGLRRTYLSPFHRSSSPSVIAVGKENNMQGQTREVQGSQLCITPSDRQVDVQKDNRNGSSDETRPPTSWSPRRGKREQESGESTSATQVRRKGDEANEVNRDFERLLDQIQISDTVRSRLTRLDTPLKKSLLRSPLALDSLIGSDSSSMPSPARPGADRSRAQSMLSAGTVGQQPGLVTNGKVNQFTNQKPHQIRKMQSGSSLRGAERGNSPASMRTQGSTAGMKTEYVNNLKFVVLNGSPPRTGVDSRQKNHTRPGNGKRTSYHHTAEGIPVPPPLLPGEDFSPDLQDKEYDFLHDAFQTSRNGDFTSGTLQHSYAASSIGTASSNSSAGSRLHKTGPKPCDTDKKIKQKRSSVFGTKTKASKKDGYTTGDEASCRTTMSTQSKREGKRMSYTFGQSFSRSRTPGGETDHLPLMTSRMNGAGSTGLKERPRDLPLSMAAFLRDAKTFAVDVDQVKRLRLLLGSESASWVQTFIDAGGYKYLLLRLQDLLDVEWRSEQHDDQLFFEILRCIKGLATSEPGKEAIIEHGATPFRELVDLLYSEKKPGEVPPRQLIVDLVLSLFDIYRPGPRSDGTPSTMTSPAVRPGSSPLIGVCLPSSGKDNASGRLGDSQDMIPGGHKTISAFILSLLREPASMNDDSSPPLPTLVKENRKSIIIAPASELPAPKVEMHDFIAAAHKPRIFKTYMKELSQACWDFFWIMHYSKNGIWNLADVDTEKIRPRAPNGASAGVEFEAMRYLTSHFRLINTLTRTLIEQDIENEAIRKDMRKGEACKFHAAMMFSGMDRILCTVRKASTDLYPEFHLELARYIKLAVDTEFDLPYLIRALITPPPDLYRKPQRTVTLQHHEGQTSRRNLREQDNYRSAQLLRATPTQSTVQTTQWLPTPTEKGDFDFQL
ncbi:hypothetical protein QFC21_006032 [Naganishia friedmannii]|uniref:Uncharacterized protein n=1 Tax=Naganishia friedmannii TaxID=89922 RepID=A0ACC2V562_9TREE|nr:hypothetical protein QFC21_006032 [Naganishia friedmannii]